MNLLFSFSLTWNPIEVKKIKTPLPLQVSAKSLKHFLNFPPNCAHIFLLEMFDFLNLNNSFFENFKLTMVPYGETQKLNYLDQMESNLGLTGSSSTYMGYR